MSRSNKEKHSCSKFPLEDDFSKETFSLMKNLMAVGAGKWAVEKISFYRFNIRVALIYFIRKISFQGYKLIPYDKRYTMIKKKLKNIHSTFGFNVDSEPIKDEL